MRSISRIPIFASLALSAISALVLSFESYLSLQGKSLCKTEACEIVGTTIRFGEPLLIAGGAVFFWLFGLAYFFSRRYPQYLQHIPSVLLFSALAFDGALIGFQLFAIQQRCFLCLSVAALLVTLALSHAIAQKSYILFFSALGIWLGGFIALGILKMPLPTGAYANMAFYEYKVQPTEGTQLSTKDAYKLTLIMSMNCPHCLDVISYLSDNPSMAATYKLVTIDQDKDSLKKISRFKKEAGKNDNPFILLKEIKAGPVSPDQDIAKDLPEKAVYGLQFLSNLGISEIPVLIAESIDKNKTVLIGSDAIIDFFRNGEDSRHTLGNHSP